MKDYFQMNKNIISTIISFITQTKDREFKRTIIKNIFLT